MASGGEELTNSEESCDVNCTICSKKNRTKQATSYCKECTKYLCVDCVEIHIDHIDDHTLVDMHDVGQFDDILTEKCGKHRDQVIELFCVDHDELACTHCATLEHRSCRLKAITESLEEVKKSSSVQEQLQTALKQMDQVISALDTHTEELSQTERKYLLEIEEYTKQLLARIEDLKRNARQDVTAKHQQLATKAEKNRQACTTSKTYINKCIADTKLPNRTKSHLFILEKKGLTLTRNVETLSKDTEQLIKSTLFEYQANSRIGQYLTDTTYLGRIVEKYKTNMRTGQYPTDKYRASLKGTINATKRNDSKTCDIQGCCLLTDGTVLLTDGNNKKVKHVDPSSGTIKDNRYLDGELRGITYIGVHKVAVGTQSRQVMFISPGNKLACKSTIQMNHDCPRIAYSNGELFTTYGNRVYVHGLNGTLLRTICKNRSGEEMFSSAIMGIVLNQAGDRVYVADWDKGLICTDRVGHEFFRRSEEELGLSGAHGVCTDQRGYVLVCGCWSNNVVQVTENGRVIGEILSTADGIEKPRCLCYDADRELLYVGGGTPKLWKYQMV